MKTKAVLYLRCAVLENKPSNAILMQEKTLEDFCRKENFEIVNRFADVCSGSHFRRKEWQNLLKYVELNKSIDVILITQFDRYSRSISEGIKMTKILQDLGVTLYATEQNFEVTAKQDIN